MSLLTRRGFTLIELMIALVLLGMVSASIYKVLVNNQRIYMAQTQQIDLQQNIRAAATILPAEFRELDAGEGDITKMGPDSIRMRAMRQLSFLCTTPALGGGIGQLSLVIRPTPIYGNRQTFAKDDSLLVYYEGDPTTRNDDTWRPAQVGQAACDDGTQGISLTLQPQWINDPLVNVVGAITNGSPVRGFDKVAYRVYQAPSPDNQWYLGQRNPATGGTIQPLIGPLIGPNGVTFTYLDANGAVTTDSSRV